METETVLSELREADQMAGCRVISALTFAALAAGGYHLIDLTGEIVTDAWLDSVDEILSLCRAYSVGPRQK